jgi:hypothetical protein
MTDRDIIDNYFEWLFDIVCGKRYSEQISYRKLLMRLHETEFTFTHPMDRNRAENGTNLRYRFSVEMGWDDIPGCLNGSCSVLEMMVALAMKCEEWMDDAHIGNRTSQWFWGMITNLGLGSMMDSRFDRKTVDLAIERFLNRQYEPDGKGGLFTIKRCNRDLRDVEIWYQLCWYLESIT